MIRWLERIPEAAGRNRLVVVLVVTLVTALAVLALPNLKVQAGIYELFPRQPGPISALADHGRAFGHQRQLLVLVSSSDAKVVAPAVRQTAAELDRSELFLDVRAGVEASSVLGKGAISRSLLLLADDQTWRLVKRRLSGPLAPWVGRLRRLLLSPLTPSQEALASDPLGLSELVFDAVESDVDPETGLFASPDGRAALIFARPAAEGSDRSFRRRLQRELQAIRGRVRAELPTAEVQFTGPHLYGYHFERTLRRDLALSSTLALAGVLLLLFLLFRSIRLLPLAGLIGGLAVCWVLAVVVLAQGRLNLISLAFAALCIGMGMDGLIHLTARTREVAGEPRARVVMAARALLPALLATTVTTIAAFLLLLLSAFAGLAQTGLLAAAGLAITLVLTLTLAPVLAAPAPAVPPREPVLDRLLVWLAGGVRRSHGWILLGAGGVGAACGVAAAGLTFSSDISRLAPKHFPPVQTDLAIAAKFERGRDRVIVAARGHDLQQVLEANDRIASCLARLRQAGQVTGYRSLAAILPSLATQRLRRRRLTPEEAQAAVERLRSALTAGGLRPEAFESFFQSVTAPETLTPERLPKRLQPLVRRQLRHSDGNWVVATTVHVAGRNQHQHGVRLQRVTRELQKVARTGVAVGITGAALAGEQMSDLLRHDLLLVSSLSLCVVVMMVGILLRRIRPALALVVSLLWTGLVFAGTMRLFGNEVDLYNLMVLPVLIGYGVDDHIYVIRRAATDGTHVAVVRSGRAVVATTVTSVVAFSALWACDLPGLRVLGSTAVLGLTLGLLGSLVVMPAVLTFLGGRSDEDNRL